VKRSSIWVAVLLAIALTAAGCGSSKVSTDVGQGSSVSESPTSTPDSATTATAAPGGQHCQFAADTVSAAVPQVLVQAPGSASPAAVTAKRQLGCGAVVQVDKSGAANIAFGGTADCQLLQDAPGQKVATAVSRDPANALLRLVEGTVLCTFPKGGSRVRLCGPGEIQITGTVDQVAATCNMDPTFSVALLRGQATVKDPSGAVHDIGDGDQLGCDPNNCHAGIAQASFTDRQQAVFRAQAEAMRVSPNSTSSSSTTTSSTTSTSGAKPTTTTIG
jgi:hypothetical protein